MSMFRDALRAMLTTALQCPRCAAHNRPGATYVEIDETGSRAYCTVCSAEGPLCQYQPRKDADESHLA